MTTKIFKCEITKTDKKLGIVYGWAIKSTDKGEAYFDKQDDHIPTDAMAEAAQAYMKGDRVIKEGHTGENIGIMTFAMPITKDLCTAMGMTSDIEGLLVGFEPNDEEILKKFEDGELTGFSIGGTRLEDEVIIEETDDD